jgi:hypothetical protein
MSVTHSIFIREKKKALKKVGVEKLKYTFHAHCTSYTTPVVLMMIEHVRTCVPESLQYAYIS